MSGYQDAVTRLTENTERVVLQVLATLDPEDVPDLAATLIARANAQGHYLSEAALAGWLAVRLGQPPGVAAVGLAVEPTALDLGRLTEAARTAIADPEQAATRLGRLARSEPAHTAQAAMSRAMDSTPHVAGWTRELNPGACELCEYYADGGRVFPTSLTMAHHPGCTCAQQPVATR